MSPADRLAKAVQKYVRKHYGQTANECTLRVRLDDGMQVEMPLPVERHALEFSTERLCPADEAILQVLRALEPGECLHAEVIALRAGYVYGGWFRSRLYTLSRIGFVKSCGRDGYTSAERKTALFDNYSHEN